jgi:hypothetical protein
MTHPKKINDKIKTQKFLNNFPFIFLVQHQNLTVKEWLELKNTIYQHVFYKNPECSCSFSTKNCTSEPQLVLRKPQLSLKEASSLSQNPKKWRTELSNSFFEKLEILNVKNSVLLKIFQNPQLELRKPQLTLREPQLGLRVSSHLTKSQFKLGSRISSNLETQWGTHSTFGNQHSTEVKVHGFESLCQGPNFLLGCRDEIHLPLLWTIIQSHSKLVFISCIYKNQLLNHLDVEALLKTQNSVYFDLLNQLNNSKKLINILKQGCIPSPLLRMQSDLYRTLVFLKNSQQRTYSQ